MITTKDAGLRYGLALGGGGARGWAHIGVLKALAEHNITISAYAGTSIGALIGGFAAAGKISELESVLSEMDIKRIILLFAEKKFPRSGLVDGRHVVELLSKHLGYPLIEQLPVPFSAVATDVENGLPVILDRGDLVSAIRASIAIPGMFTPINIQDRYLVDGGLVNPLPVSLLKHRGLDRIIAVNLHGDGLNVRRGGRSIEKVRSSRSTVNSDSTAGKTIKWLERQRVKVEQSARSTVQRWLSTEDSPNIFQVMANTADIVSTQLTLVSLKEYPPDLLIQPKVGGIGHLEFHRVEETITLGYEAANEALKKWSIVS